MTVLKYKNTRTSLTTALCCSSGGRKLVYEASVIVFCEVIVWPWPFCCSRRCRVDLRVGGRGMRTRVLTPAPQTWQWVDTPVTPLVTRQWC